MACITLTALQALMTTTKLIPAVHREAHAPWLPRNTAQKPVRMNWVVVTESNGTQQLRVNWNVAQHN